MNLGGYNITKFNSLVIHQSIYATVYDLSFFSKKKKYALSRFGKRRLTFFFSLCDLIT